MQYIITNACDGLYLDPRELSSKLTTILGTDTTIL